MTYSKLQSILPNDEIHYLSDVVDQQDQPEYQSDNHTYILFEYTIHDFYDTISRLKSNNIAYTIHTDSYNLDFIII